ncbi:DUF1349 domain-containing protein [Kineosporia sp. J2-2]|uniref:DUF1349 domain-containing protein n=1 Tax=Kineosporia corallincola TaxID=2835133 RepID=A0ABS5TBJ6_9ACTN|nr:DUF1349 domain-containing protein [Kineosporia corallincola]MBT0768411.1 DUF1349 domain-containing protein [Kineosporia corallincola]
MTTTSVPGLPFDLTASPDSTWTIDADVLRTTAHPRSDIFVDPTFATDPQLNASTLLALPPGGDFQLSARVRVDFASTFDAGVLLLWAGDRHWGKLCFEYSPAGEPMVVSVVCREISDDANAFVVEDGAVWLRVSRIGRTFAYHASTDGKVWKMVRYFALDVPGNAVRVGFEAQSPTGEGCTVDFDEIRFAPERLEDVRNGS